MADIRQDRGKIILAHNAARRSWFITSSANDVEHYICVFPCMIGVKIECPDTGTCTLDRKQAVSF